MNSYEGKNSHKRLTHTGLLTHTHTFFYLSQANALWIVSSLSRSNSCVCVRALSTRIQAYVSAIVQNSKMSRKLRHFLPFASFKFRLDDQNCIISYIYCERKKKTTRKCVYISVTVYEWSQVYKCACKCTIMYLSVFLLFSINLCVSFFRSVKNFIKTVYRLFVPSIFLRAVTFSTLFFFFPSLSFSVNV